MSQNTPSFFLKRFSGFLHFIFALIALTGVGFMYLNSNYGRGLDWIEDETFDQSPDFNKKVQADIASISTISSTRSFLRPMERWTTIKWSWTSPPAPAETKSYTLNDIILYGKSLGYYMDEADNYALKGGPENLSAEDEERIMCAGAAISPRRS